MTAIHFTILIACAVTLTVALVWLAVNLVRAVQKLENNLDMLNRELPPTLESLRRVSDEASVAVENLKRASERIEHTTQSATEVVDSTLGFLAATGGKLGRWSIMLSGLATGIRAATEAFGRSHRKSDNPEKEKKQEKGVNHE